MRTYTEIWVIVTESFYSENLIDLHCWEPARQWALGDTLRDLLPNKAHRAHVRRKAFWQYVINLLPELWCLQKQNRFLIFTRKKCVVNSMPPNSPDLHNKPALICRKKKISEWHLALKCSSDVIYSPDILSYLAMNLRPLTIYRCPFINWVTLRPIVS